MRKLEGVSILTHPLLFYIYVCTLRKSACLQANSYGISLPSSYPLCYYKFVIK